MLKHHFISALIGVARFIALRGSLSINRPNRKGLTERTAKTIANPDRKSCSLFAPLIGLLTLIVGSQNLSAQSQIAQDAYAIFEGSCLICHGADGAYRETLLMEHATLIEKGTVVPGNPDASELYKRLLGNTERGVQMPFGQPPLPTQSIEAIRRWILAGAPDWATIPFNRTAALSLPLKYSIPLRLTSCHSTPFDRAYARYFTLGAPL